MGRVSAVRRDGAPHRLARDRRLARSHYPGILTGILNSALYVTRRRTASHDAACASLGQGHLHTTESIVPADWGRIAIENEIAIHADHVSDWCTPCERLAAGGRLNRTGSVVQGRPPLHRRSAASILNGAWPARHVGESTARITIAVYRPLVTNAMLNQGQTALCGRGMES